LASYKVFLTRTAEAAYRWLREKEPAVFDRVRAVLESLANDPLQGKPLKGGLTGVRSYRVGAYRIVYEVDKGRLVVLVLDIGNRREIYR